MRTIDLHMHLPGKAYGTGRWDTPGFLAMMDRCGIDQAVVMSVDGLFFDDAAANNAVYQQTQEADRLSTRGRLIPFCTVLPRLEGAAAEVRRCVEELGFRGVKLHPLLQGFSPLESYALPVAAEAARLGVPILFHDGSPPYCSPLQIAYLCELFPNLQVILGHGGRMDLWVEAIAAARRYPNCTICLCGVEPPAIFAKVIRDAPLDQITIGTDAGWTKDEYLAEFRLAEFRDLAAELPPAVQEAIFWRNAARLLKLEEAQ